MIMDRRRFNKGRFKAGESGNPAGRPKGRVDLWPLFCKYLSEMTLQQLTELNKSPSKINKMRLVERTALQMALQASQGFGGVVI